MKKIISMAIAITFFSIFVGQSQAQSLTDIFQQFDNKNLIQEKLADILSEAEQELPEIEGIYDVPGRANMKVRVFVYRQGNLKPTPSNLPALVCDLTDPESNALVASTGWRLPAAWNYRLNPNSVPSLVGRQNLAAISANAFGEWQDAVSEVAVARGKDTPKYRAAYDLQNIIAWGNASASALAVSYIWYYPSTGLVAEVDTIFNKRFSWRWSDPSAWPSGETTCAFEQYYDAQNILTHELGHWYGLNDHYTDSYQHNTMYGYGSKGETKKDTLTSGDINGVEAIY